MSEEFVALARHYRVATVFADSDDYPSFADLTADFVYARLMRTRPSVQTGYTKGALDEWAARARTWAAGGEPRDLPRIAKASAKTQPRDVYLFMIGGAKERAPAAARALLSRLGEFAPRPTAKASPADSRKAAAGAKPAAVKSRRVRIQR
jgi:uncharacterized protein YecE (DUF72 family)